jgi:hypothetical protein
MRTELWCDKTTTATVPVSRLWRGEPANDETTVAPASWTPRNRTIAWPADDVTIAFPHTPRPVAATPRNRTTTKPIREFPSYKEAEKRKIPGADMPAEKKARTDPSSYSVAVPESESD